jgi:hypothetical protein
LAFSIADDEAMVIIDTSTPPPRKTKELPKANRPVTDTERAITMKLLPLGNTLVCKEKKIIRMAKKTQG